MNRDNIPTKSFIETSKGDRTLEIRPDAIFSGEGETCKEIMFCVQDVTEREALKKEVEKREKQESKRNKILTEIAPRKEVNLEEHKEDLHSFFLNTEELLSEVTEICSLKTMKGQL